MFSQIVFGLLSAGRKSWIESLVQSTSYEVRDLIPGSDYGLSIQTMLGSDVSQAVKKELSTRKKHLHTKTNIVDSTITVRNY